MQKVYLLLRDNQQTGPFSLEELIRFDLKPFDLIWIEGKSAGWYYPQEIQALQPHLAFLKQPTTQPPSSPLVDIKNKPAENSVQPKKVFVSMPSNTTKEPELKPHLTGYPTETPKMSEPVLPTTEAEKLQTSYSKSLQEAETDYMNWLYKKKDQEKIHCFG